MANPKPTHTLRVPKHADAFVSLGAAPGSTPVPPPEAEPAPLHLAAQPASPPVSGATPSGARQPAAQVPVVTMPVAAQPASPPAGQPASRLQTVRRVDGRELRKQTIYLPPELAVRLKVYCATSSREMSEVAVEALEAFLAQAR